MQRQFSLFAEHFARAVWLLFGSRASARASTPMLASCAFLCAFGCTKARAYEEQASLDLALGYAGIVKSESLNSHLGSIDVGASLGVRDFLVLRAALGYGLLLQHSEKTQHAGRGRFEAAYLVDVLQWVPFFGLGVGVWGVRREPDDLAWFATGHGVLGLDWLINRRFTLGCDVRIGMLLEAGELVSYTEGQLRSSFMFELF